MLKATKMPGRIPVEETEYAPIPCTSLVYILEFGNRLVRLSRVWQDSGKLQDSAVFSSAERINYRTQRGQILKRKAVQSLMEFLERESPPYLAIGIGLN